MAVMDHVQDCEDSLIQTAQRHFEQKEYVKALKAFTRAVNAQPDHEEACLGKVLVLKALNRPRGALKACETALGFFPDSQPFLELRAELAHELGDEADEIVAAAAVGPADAKAPSLSDDDTDCTTDASDGEPGCPASQSQERSQQQAAAVRAQLSASRELEAKLTTMASEESAAYRKARKDELIHFYRDFYGRTRSASLDVSQYSKAEKKGLSIEGGHRPIPRPDHVELPEDYRQPVGVLSPAELATYNADNKRLLISVHGDVFDVSDRPDKYGSEGPYHSMAGHDITWALWSGYDDEQEWDKYFDLHQAKPKEEKDRRLQGLMSWWAFYEQEYGAPVGRLGVYEREWDLPAPPPVQDLCCVM